MSRKNKVKIFKLPSEAKVEAAKINESPGKKGVTTKPVSQKIIINKIKYVSVP